MAETHAFLERLRQLGTTPAQVLRQIEAPPGALVIGYTSQIDGFGTEQSDLDLYVYAHSIIAPRTESLTVGPIIADVEFSPASALAHLTERFARADLDDPEAQHLLPGPGDVKNLYRLKVGACLQVSPDMQALCDRIPMERLGQVYVRLNRLAVDDAAEDTIRQIEAGDFIAAVHMGRKGLDHAIMAYLAQTGVLIFKYKWLHAAIRNHLGADHSIYKAFLHYHFGVRAEEADRAVEEMFRYWERLLSGRS